MQKMWNKNFNFLLSIFFPALCSPKWLVEGGFFFRTGSGRTRGWTGWRWPAVWGCRSARWSFSAKFWGFFLPFFDWQNKKKQVERNYKKKINQIRFWNFHRHNKIFSIYFQAKKCWIEFYQILQFTYNWWKNKWKNWYFNSRITIKDQW